MKTRGNNLMLGQLVGRDAILGYSPDQRDKHLYICGGTGTGKSKFLEHLIRQDIKAWPKQRCGMLVLDPHGSLYDGLINWLSWHNLDRPIIPIDLRQDEWVVSYNLLRQRRTADPAVLVDNITDAMAYVWGQSGTNQTPLFARWAGNVIHALYEKKLTLVEAEYLIDRVAKQIRSALTADLKDKPAQQDWRFADTLSAKEFEAQIGSTVNRLQRFIRNQTMRSIFGQPEVSLDLGAALEAGSIILVNLATERARVSKENAELFATVLLSDLWTAAQERGKRDGVKPFYVYMDEFQRFVTPTISDNLDEARGFGLHLTMAHQFPLQLLDRGENGRRVYNSIMENASSKVAFRLTYEENLIILAKWLFMGVMNPDEIKHELYSRKVMEYREELREVLSEAESVGATRGSRRGDAAGRGAGGTNTFSVDGERASVSFSHSHFASDSWGKDESESESKTTSRSVVPMLVPVFGKELSHVQFRSLEEQLFRAMAVLFDQQQRQGVARLVGMKAPVSLITPTIKALPRNEERVKRYLNRCYEKLPFALRHSEALENLAARAEYFSDGGFRATADEPLTAARNVPASEQTTGECYTEKMLASGIDAPIDVQPRDLEVLRGLLESRVMTLSHLAALYFEGRDEAAKKRVQKLKAAGLTAEKPRRVNEPAILYLTRGGLAVLEQNDGVPEHLKCSPNTLAKRVDVSPLTLQHELAVMDVKAAFARSIFQSQDLRLIEFCTIPSVHSFDAAQPKTGEPFTMKPDAFIQVNRAEPDGSISEYRFFLELDRSTETQETLATKAHCYFDYFRSGGFAARHGAAREEYKAFPFRVLIVCKSEERRANAARRLLENSPPILTHAWFATFAEVTSRPCDAIWLTPFDYRTAGSSKPSAVKALFA